MIKTKNLEIFRKVWHTFNGLAIATIYQFNLCPISYLTWSLTFLFIFSLTIEYFRSTNKELNQVCIKIMKPIIRKRELKDISGVPFYLLGCLFVILFFSKTIAILSILYLAIGDSIASFCGRKWGHLGPKFLNKKSYIGSMSAIISCTFISYIYLRYFSSFTEHERLLICILGGITGGVAELISLVDDNLFIPIFSGFCLYLFFYFC
jgi:dolichol kinase